MDASCLNSNVNKRDFVRIDLLKTPMSAILSLESFRGKSLGGKTAEVALIDLSAGGLRFLSSLRLPLEPELRLSIRYTFQGQTREEGGFLVWGYQLVPKSPNVAPLYGYGLKYDELSEGELQSRVKLVNSLQRIMRGDAPRSWFYNSEDPLSKPLYFLWKQHLASDIEISYLS